MERLDLRVADLEGQIFTFRRELDLLRREGQGREETPCPVAGPGRAPRLRDALWFEAWG